jgi:chromosome condensin MukBEF ATPase and DNA-binding subunit MukB
LRSSNAADGDTLNLKEDDMDHMKKTTSGRWEVDRDITDPKAKWVGKKGWQSQPPAEQPSIAQIAKWIEDMGDWCEMMYDTVIELRERVSLIEGDRPKIAQLGQDLHQLDQVVKNLNPPPGTRPAAAQGPLT